MKLKTFLCESCKKARREEIIGLDYKAGLDLTYISIDAVGNLLDAGACLYKSVSGKCKPGEKCALKKDKTAEI